MLPPFPHATESVQSLPFELSPKLRFLLSTVMIKTYMNILYVFVHWILFQLKFFKTSYLCLLPNPDPSPDPSPEPSPNEEVDKIIKTESIYYPDTLIDNCASPDAQNESNVQITNRRKRYTANKKAEECPDDSWWYNGYGSCVHYNPNLGRKKWSEATSYCESLGDNIGLFAVEDEGRGYSTLWDALHKEGKYIFWFLIIDISWYDKELFYY